MDMFSSDGNDFVNMDEMESWLENYFLDPLTSYLDQITFRIDIFETDDKYIVEAIPTESEWKAVSVYLEDHTVHIMVCQIGTNSQIRRKVCLPFSVIEKEVKAVYSKGVLEIFIDKGKQGEGVNRLIPVRGD